MLIPKFNIEPGDGTGNSIADAQVRNSKGICIVQDCNKLMIQEDDYYYFCGFLCEEHKKSIKDNQSLFF